ncbi:MAG: repeat protein, partial [Candidatus Binatus sp.]|nr:repeat protein [Candidatus Binatus sp.]
PTATVKGKTPTPTALPAATSTTVPSGPGGVPTGGLVQYSAQGLFGKGNKNPKLQFEDLTQSAFWTSTNQNSLIPPASVGPQGGNYTTGAPGCACIQASSSGIASQSVGVGVYVDVSTCALCPTGAIVSNASGVSAAASITHNAGVMMWAFDAGSEIRGKIAIAGNGSVYFITHDGMLHGVSRNGKQILHRGAAGHSPVAMPDGTVVAKSSRTELAAFAADGSIKWQAEVGAGDGPIAASKDTVYVSSGTDLVAVASDGSVKWRVASGPVDSGASSADGVVVATFGGQVTSLGSDGAVAWTFAPLEGFSGSLSVAGDAVYAGSKGGNLYALDLRTGKTLWQLSSAHPVLAGPDVGASGAIFFGSNAIYGVSPEGQLRFTQNGVNQGAAVLAAVGNQDVFDSSGPDSLGAMLDGDGNFIWSSRSFGKITAVAASPDGVLYVATKTGRLMAIK